MESAVQEVRAALEAAWEQYRVRCVNMRKQYEGVSLDGGARFSEYRHARDQSREALEEAVGAAWNALNTHSDPLVRWIGKECRGWADHALAVLEALPMRGLESFWELADREVWCWEFEGMLVRAAKAGVVPGVSPQRAELLAWAWGDDAGGSPLGDRVDRCVLRELMSLVDSIVGAEGVPSRTIDDANACELSCP